jgi:di/tricarboxylate transporter
LHLLYEIQQSDIAFLYVLGDGLVRSGLARCLGDWIQHKAAGRDTKLLMRLIMVGSSAFMTPVCSPVVSPGNYRFGNFVWAGVAFTDIVMIVAVIMVPILLPP